MVHHKHLLNSYLLVVFFFLIPPGGCRVLRKFRWPYPLEVAHKMLYRTCSCWSETSGSDGQTLWATILETECARSNVVH